MAFDTSTGGEIRKQRPAVIISNDMSNKYLNRVQIVPLTSNIKQVYSHEALVAVNGGRNKAMADQLTTVSKQRLTNIVARLSHDDMQKVERAVRIQLGLLG